MEKLKQLLVKLPEELKEAFFTHCKSNGYSPSKRLRVLMDEDIKNAKTK